MMAMRMSLIYTCVLIYSIVIYIKATNYVFLVSSGSTVYVR